MEIIGQTLTMVSDSSPDRATITALPMSIPTLAWASNVAAPKGNDDCGGDDDDSVLPPPLDGGGGDDGSGPSFNGYFDIESSAVISIGVLLLVILAALEVVILATKLLE